MATLNLNCTLVFLFVGLLFCDFRAAEAGIGDHDQEAIDEIKAYIDSLAENPSLHYWKPADIDEEKGGEDSDKQTVLSPRSAAETVEGTCKAGTGAGSCSEAPSQTSFSTGLPVTSEKDFSNMNMGELMNELIQLTQKHPEEVESVIEMYKQMIAAAGDTPP